MGNLTHKSMSKTDLESHRQKKIPILMIVLIGFLFFLNINSTVADLWGGESEVTDYWKLDEFTSSVKTVALNTNDTNRNGTLIEMGTANWNASGVIKGSLEFNETDNSRVEIGDIDMIEQANFTIQSWVQLNTSWSYSDC